MAHPATPKAAGGESFQIFILQPGRTMKTTGTFDNVLMVSCVSGGDITVTYPDDPVETITLNDGEQFGFGSPVSVTVDTATIHYMA